MSTKRKETRDIISIEKEKISSKKEETDDSSQAKIKSNQSKNAHRITFTIYFFIFLWIIIKAHTNKDSTFKKSLDSTVYKSFYILSLLVNRIKSSTPNGLSKFNDFIDIDLYFCYIVHFFIVYIE